ncbi:splicing factor u2af large subunit, putative, partial [Ichthyophthirius multifiliis]
MDKKQSKKSHKAPNISSAQSISTTPAGGQNLTTQTTNTTEKRTRNVFSSPPKVQPAVINPVSQIDPGLRLGQQVMESATIPLASQLYTNQLGLGIGDMSIGNKIPPALQKNYIHALRIYIGNIPDPIDTEDVCHFVYKSLLESGGLLEPGNPIISKKNDPIKKFIFLQLRSIEETSACMQLDGILYKGKSLRFRRPKDYTTMPQVEGTRKIPILDRNKLRIVQTQVENTYNKLQVMNIPETISEEHVMQILQNYGELRSFHLAVDIYTGESKGFAFCEYLTDKATMDCLNQLSGQQILNKIINVKRCNPNLAPPVEEQMQPIEVLVKNLCDFINKSILESGFKDIQEEYIQKVISNEGQKYSGLNQEEATSVLKIKNVIDKQVIEEDPEYEFIYNDLKQQLVKFGRLKQMIIPRLKEKYQPDSVGLVFVEFENEKICQ